MPPRRRQEPDAERSPAEMEDGELDDFIERGQRESERPGREGWRAFYQWCEATDERRRRRFGRAGGPVLIRREEP